MNLTEYINNKKYLLLLLLCLIAIIGIYFLTFSSKTIPVTNKKSNIKELTQVMFGYMPFVSNWPLFLAVEKNYFQEDGLKVELVQFNSGVDAINALSKGDIDSMAVNPLGDLFNIEIRTPGLFKIYAMQQSTSNDYIDSLLVKKGSDIRTIDDLIGKRIGVNPGTVAETFTKIMLEKNGHKSTQTEIIKLAPNLQLQALETGQIEALVAYEPNISYSLKQNKAQVLMPHFFEGIMDPFPNVGFTISSKLINKNPEIAKKIVAVIEKSIKYGKANQKEAYKSSSKYTNLTDDILDQIHNPQQLLGNEINKNQVQAVADLYYEKNLITKRIKVDDLFYLSND